MSFGKKKKKGEAVSIPNSHTLKRLQESNHKKTIHFLGKRGKLAKWGLGEHKAYGKKEKCMGSLSMTFQDDLKVWNTVVWFVQITGWVLCLRYQRTGTCDSAAERTALWKWTFLPKWTSQQHIIPNHSRREQTPLLSHLPKSILGFWAT